MIGTSASGSGSERQSISTLGRSTGPRLLRRTRDGDPLAALIRLFVAGVPVPLDDFRRAVEPMDPAVWAELGLVELEGDSARRSVMLLPSEGFLDRPRRRSDRRGHPPRPRHGGRAVRRGRCRR